MPKLIRARYANIVPMRLFDDSTAIGLLSHALLLEIATSRIGSQSLREIGASHLTTMCSSHSHASVSRWRTMLAAPLVVAVFAVAILVRQAYAAETQRIVVSPGRAQQVVNLRDRLVVGLQARLKSEVAFVESVAAKVRTGKLPQHVVDETFFWARERASIRRNGYSRRPIIFFQPAMTARAKRLHVEL